jgi:hypothetical protein
VGPLLNTLTGERCLLGSVQVVVWEVVRWHAMNDAMVVTQVELCSTGQVEVSEQ